jgi:hypothetical protein
MTPEAPQAGAARAGEMIRLEAVRKSFGDNLVLDGIDLEVAPPADARLGRARRTLRPRGGPAEHAPRGRYRRDGERRDRRPPGYAAHDPHARVAHRDPALRRGLPRPADPRHGLRDVLPAAEDLALARVLGNQCGHDRAHALGQRAGGRGDARRRAVDPPRAARRRLCARLRVGRQPRLRDPAAGAAAASAADGEPAREHHPEHDARGRDRRARFARCRQAPERAPLHL